MDPILADILTSILRWIITAALSAFGGFLLAHGVITQAQDTELLSATGILVGKSLVVIALLATFAWEVLQRSKLWKLINTALSLPAGSTINDAIRQTKLMKAKSNPLSRFAPGIIAIFAIAFTGCTLLEQQEFSSWLNSPTVQAELTTLESFAFGLLNAWLESNLGATSVATGSISFAPVEPAIISAVQTKYNLNPVQATYVVKQAELQVAQAHNSTVKMTARMKHSR